MHRTRWQGPRWALVAAALVATALMAAAAADAQDPSGADNPGPAPVAPGSAVTLSWYTVDGGGTSPDAGTVAGQGQLGVDADVSQARTADLYTLGATIGQPDAGSLAGGSYTLAGGFWAGQAPAPPGLKTYLPVVMRLEP